ncbi:hypothetical protein SLA2020_027990 [Shorea laevis]
MASLVLLLSELLRHRDPSFSSSSTFPASTSQKSSASRKQLGKNEDGKYYSEMKGEDLQELRVSVDLVWP